MNFNSLEYLIFLPVCIILYYALPAKIKNPVMLAASYFFYMCWEPAYALLMLFSTAVTYFCALLIDKKALGKRKLWLILCLGVNLAILFFFKYCNFVTGSLGLIFGIKAPTVNVLLPVGISFYTFQALAYTLDVYRRDVPCEKNFIDYALFVSFFPQLVAGPIERTANILPQLKIKRLPSFDRAFSGILLILWGLFKKMVLADNLALIVNTVYGAPQEHNGARLVFATVAFAFQIYCDFSAYTDIARGSARLMGIELMENFKCPYLAQSIKDFWRRWHISLSTWFKDYLYFPLGGSRVPKWRHIFNILVVFAVSGLWHGAAFGFILWGVLHGVYQAVAILLSPLRRRIYEKLPENALPLRVLRVVICFALVCFAWIFFRADSLSDGFYIAKQVLTLPFSGDIFPLAFATLGLSRKALAVTGSLLLFALIFEAAGMKKDLFSEISKSLAGKYLFALFLCIVIFVFGYYGKGYDPQAFVYFQF